MATILVFSRLSGAYSDAGTGTCGTSLNPNSSCTFVVRFTSPGDAGSGIDTTLMLSYHDGSQAQLLTTPLSITGTEQAVSVQAVYPNNLSLTYDYVHGPRRSIFSGGLNINRYFASEAPTFSNKYSGDLYADFVEPKNQETVLMLLKYNCQVGHDFIHGCQVPDTIVGIDQLWSLLQSLQSSILNDEAVERNFERKEKMENDVAVELKKITRDSRWVQLTQGILSEKKALHRRIPIPVDEVVGISPLEIRIALNTLSNLIQNSEALDLLYQLDIDKFLIYDRNQYLVSDTSALPVAFSYLHFGNTIDQLYEYLKTLPRRPHAQNHGAHKKN